MMSPIMLFRKILASPQLRSDRMAVYMKQDGGLYASDGATGVERRIVMTTIWPVGSIFLTAQTTNPATLLGFGTWARLGEGRTLVGQLTSDPDFDVVEEVGGAKTVTLTDSHNATHTHTQNAHTHTQDAHTHTQNAHGHTQDSHNHTQNSHAHSMDTNIARFVAGSGWFQGATARTIGGTTQGQTGTNQNATATNQIATATNNAVTATNQSTTATNQNAGSSQPHNNLPPYIVVYTWKRTA